MKNRIDSEGECYLGGVAFSLITTITFVTLLLVVCFYTDMITLPIKIVLMIIAISVFGVGLYVAMWGDRKIGYGNGKLLFRT